MWYLSRTPITDSNTEPNNPLYNPTFQNSIFPVSENGLFQEISIIDVPNNPQIINGNVPNHTNSTATQNNNLWEWFAYSPTISKFHAVAVPRSPSFMALQVLAVMPERFLCARLSNSPANPYAVLCIYSRGSNSWKDVPKLQCQERNPIGAAGAVLNGWLYLAGGYQGSYTEQSNHLNSAERLNLKTLEWQPLSPMHKPRAFATGLVHKGKFYVVGGQPLDHSAEIYNPTSNTWKLLNSFVPKEADGFAVTSMCGRFLMLLTWSDQLGIKLWLLRESVNRFNRVNPNPANPAHPAMSTRWRLLGYFPNCEVERARFRQHGARMVQVGKEVWILVGESDPICKVDGPFGTCGWPIFPAPGFLPNRGHELERKGHIWAFSFLLGGGGRVSWRQIPVYKI